MKRYNCGLMNSVDLMKAYLEGTATAGQRKELEEYVNASGEHMREYRKFKNLWELTHEPFSEGDVNLEESKKRLFSMAGIKTGFRRFLDVWRTTAAILLIPVAGAAVYLAYGHRDTGEGTAGELTYSTPYGSIIRTSLSDGTSVCLNSGSSLTYSPESYAASRRVRLDGEAYFDVEADRRHPFTVELEDGTDVTATGTSFNVDAYDTERLRVTLVEGSLDVGCRNRSYGLEKGFQLVRTSGQVRLEQPDDLFKWISWKDNILAFRGDTMEYVFGRLSDIFNVEIEVKDTAILAMKLRATFSDDKIEDIMSVLEEVLPISCTRAERAENATGRKKFTISSK